MLQTLIGHNEDWVSDMIGQDILLCAQVLPHTAADGTTYPEEKFVVHTWPGLLPGMNSGFNQHGLFFSIDHLFPKHVVQGKIGQFHFNSDVKVFVVHSRLNPERKSKSRCEHLERIKI